MLRVLPLALILLVFVAESRAEALGEAVARALATFPEVRGSVANQRALQETVTQARSQYLPSIDAGLARGRERTDSPSTRALGGQETLGRSEAQLTLSQLIFDGGSVSSQVRRQQARSDSASGRIDDISESVALRVSQAFFDVLRLRELIMIAEQNVTAHRRTLQQVASTVASGVGRLSDERQSQARLALAESSLTILRGDLQQAELQYRRLTGRAPGMLVREGLPLAALPRGVQGAVDEALVAHPAIRAAKLDLEAAAAEREVARSRFAPQLSFELGASQGHDIDGVRGLNADRTAMLRLRQNLFRGGADNARVRETEARRDEVLAALEGLQNDIERDVRQAWDGLLRHQERLPALRLHADASAEVVNAYRGQFRIGQRSLLDVLNAENESFTAHSNYVTGEYSIATAVFRLLSLTGKILAQLGLAPPSAPESARTAGGAQEGAR